MNQTRRISMRACLLITRCEFDASSLEAPRGVEKFKFKSLSNDAFGYPIEIVFDGRATKPLPGYDNLRLQPHTERPPLPPLSLSKQVNNCRSHKHCSDVLALVYDRTLRLSMLILSLNELIALIYYIGLSCRGSTTFFACMLLDFSKRWHFQPKGCLSD